MVLLLVHIPGQRVTDRLGAYRGHVQTAIYNAKKRVESTNSTVPVFAAADSMFYSDPDRTIHYEGNVDIKQDTDRDHHPAHDRLRDAAR